MKSKSTFLSGLKFYLANNLIAQFPSFRVRHYFYRKVMHYSLGSESSIHMGAFVTGQNIKVGDNVVINRHVYIDGRIGVTIKNNINISPEVYIISMEHDPNDPQFATRGGEVIIDDNAWIGARAIILPGIHIGEGAVVAAGAIVTHNVEPYQIVAGVPARKIGERNKDIQYKSKYFPWFDSDVQRSNNYQSIHQNPSAKKHYILQTRIVSIIRRSFQIIREQGFKAFTKKVKNHVFPNIEDQQAKITIEHWLAFYNNKKEINPTKKFKNKVLAQPQVSILILTYNNLLLNQLCLKSIYCNTNYPNFEVIVVDNASTDGTVDWIRSFACSHSNLHLIANRENIGFAAGNNQAANFAKGDYLIFLNNDTVVSKNWIERLLQHMKDDESIGLIGPVTNATGNEAKISIDYNTPLGFEEFAGKRLHDMENKLFDINMLAFYCVMARRNQFLELGGLDERFVVGMFEDQDICVRYKKNGYRVVCAEDVFIHHFQGASFGKLDTKYYQSLFDENRSRFEEKWNTKWEPHKSRLDDYES